MTVLDEPPVPPAPADQWCVPGVERLTVVEPVPVKDAPLEALEVAVQALLAAPPAALPDEVVLARQRTVLPLIEQLKVHALGLLRQIDVRDLHLLDGAPTANTWMGVQPVAPDGVTVQTARRLARLPQAAAEAGAGRLSVRDAATVGAALDKVPAEVDEAAVLNVLTVGIADQLAELHGGDTPDAHQLRADLAELAARPVPAGVRLEAWFVLFAQAIATLLPGGALRRLLDVFVDALTPDAHDARDADLHHQRHLDLEPVLDGGWHLRGLLDAETGEALKSALDRFTAPTRKDDDDRTAGQRRHDALRELCRFSATHPDAPKATSTTREIVVYARTTTLDHAPGTLPARLASGMRLSPTTLDRISCGALFTAILLDEAGHPLKVGRTRRLFTAAQRKALHVQWGGLCAGKGCPNPGDIAHHVQWWDNAGPTDLDNAVPFCKATHHDIHTGRKTLQLKDGRWIGPEGFIDGPSP